MLELYPITRIFLDNSFPIYNLFVAFGFVCGILLFEKNIRNLPESKSRKQDAVVYFSFSVLFAFITANVLNWYIFPEVLQMPLMLRVAAAGYTWYFGFIGFILVSFFIFSFQGYRYSELLNAIVPPLTLFHGLGRIGCSLGGCCYGKPINLELLGVSVPLFPAREIEAGLLLLLTILFQTKIRKNRFVVYLLVYSIARFVLEFGRGDDRGQLFTDFLSPSQEISLFIAALVVLGFVYRLSQKVR